MTKNKDLLIYGAAAAAALFLLSKKKTVDGITGHPEYYKRQLEKIADPGGYIFSPKIKITSDNGSTNYLNINSDTIAVLNAWYKKNKRNIR